MSDQELRTPAQRLADYYQTWGMAEEEGDLVTCWACERPVYWTEAAWRSVDWEQPAEYAAWGDVPVPLHKECAT